MAADTLYNLWEAAEFGHETPEERADYRDAYNSVEWYVNTGRAPLAWEKALARADPKKLLAFILNGEDQSVDGQVARVTKYLDHYCRLNAELEGHPSSAAKKQGKRRTHRRTAER